MKKKVLSGLIFFLLLYFGFLYLNKVFTTKNYYNNTIKSFKDLSRKTNVDIVFFGSSHSYSSYNPVIISKVTHAASFNLGAPSLNITFTDLILNESLKYTKPKLIILDVFEGTLSELNGDKNKGYQLDMLDQIPFSSFSKIKDVLNEYNYKEYLTVFFPLIRNHKEWSTSLGFKKKIFIPNKELFYYHGYRGYFQSLENETIGIKDSLVESNSFLSKNKSLSNSAKEHLLTFFKIAQESQAQLLVVTSPDLRVLQSESKLLDELAIYCNSLNIKYLNLNENFREIGLEPSDFFDNQHLNLIGGTKTSNFLGNYIKNNFEELLNSNEDVLYDEIKNKYQEFEVLYANNDEKEASIMVNKTLINNIRIKNLNLKRKYVDNEIEIILDTLEISNLEKGMYNISINIFPKKEFLNLLSESSREKGRNFEKFDFYFNLSEWEYTHKYNFRTKIPEIEKIEIFLYNRIKYEGVLGEKVNIENIQFK
jgi:hypothetical protein